MILLFTLFGPPFLSHVTTASAKLLQLQLTVATQLYGVAESLSHVAAATPSRAGGASGHPLSSAGGISGWVPDAMRHREREVEELRRALKRQQQLVSDAHRQLLELSTRRKPLGAAGTASDDVQELRAALAEQEMRRMMAEARTDELQAQVRLFEEQGLRLRLHPEPPREPRPVGPGASGCQRSPGTTPAAAFTAHRNVPLFTPGPR